MDRAKSSDKVWPQAFAGRFRGTLSSEFKTRRSLDVRFEVTFHQVECLFVLAHGIGDGAIGRDEQFVVAHVSVVSGKENAEVAGDASDVQDGPGRPPGRVLPCEVFTLTRVADAKLPPAK